MSIKMRLLLSYIAMTVIPVVIFGVIAAVFFTAFVNNRDTEGKLTFWEISNERDQLSAGVKFMARSDPDRFGDGRFVQSTDEQLNRVQAGLVVMIGNEIAYASPYLKSVDLGRELRVDETKPSKHPWGRETGSRYKTIKNEITFSDGRAGAVYVLSDMNQFIDNGKKYFLILLLTLLAVVGLTNGLLTYSVSRSLVKPLFTLKQAAERIKDGDLSREVELKRKDEIGKLGEAFEDMRRRLNESIRMQLQYEENRKELISNISHDLKTPITGIKACLEGIRNGIADSGPMRDKYMGMIANKTEDMDRLIDELFLFSKLDLKRLPFHLEPTDLAAYMGDCVDELRLEPRMEGVEISFAYAGRGPVQVLADHEKLRRVIMNIIDNSLKYMNKADKHIRISLSDGADEATLRIEDNGPGIEGKALAHIFDRFYRAEPSRSSATGGSGLGLAIVKQIVEGHGGRVWAESRIGEGTALLIALRKSTGQGGEQA